MKLSHRSKKHSAFSLIELSIVILIVGILIAGVVQGGRLFAKIKRSSARTLTESSPVSGIKDLALWLETTSTKSFIETQTQDGTSVTTWYDNNPQATQKITFTNGTSTSPSYKENCINMLPCLYFNGSSTGMAMSNNGGSAINSQYSTMIAVVKAPDSFGSSSTNDSAIISGASYGYDGSSYAIPELYISYTGKPSYTIGNSGSYGILSSINTTLTNEQYYIISVVDDGTTSIFEYVNGAVANTYSSGANNGNVTKNYTLPAIGYDTMTDGTTKQHFYQGGIAEVIVYLRAITAEERKSIEKYLGQKWGISVTS